MASHEMLRLQPTQHLCAPTLSTVLRNLVAELRRCKNEQRDGYVGSLGSLMGVGGLDLTQTCVVNLSGCYSSKEGDFLFLVRCLRFCIIWIV